MYFFSLTFFECKSDGSIVWSTDVSVPFRVVLRAPHMKLVSYFRGEFEQQLYVHESPDIRNLVQSAQSELSYYYNYKLQGTIFRWRVPLVEEGEREKHNVVFKHGKNK